MSISITRQSSHMDVIAVLKEKKLEEVVDEFQVNEIDLSDFFDLELKEIHQLIPRFKIRKQFLSVWCAVTKQEFDINGLKCPLQIQAQFTPPLITISGAEPECGTSGTSVFEAFGRTECETSASGNPWVSDSPSPGIPVARKALQFESPADMAIPLRRSPRKHNSSECGSSSSPKKRKVVSSNKQEQSSTWLKDFCIPTRWEPDVERGLQRGSLNPMEKNSLVRQICTSILAHTTSPGVDERSHIAVILVQKYPFLKGSFGSGHQIWAKKIQERVLNVRRRSARHERKEYYQEQGIPAPKGKPGRKKKESNKVMIPVTPEGETDETMESQRKKLVQMFKSRPHNISQASILMENTFPKRRRDVLLNNTRVWKLLQDYPFLTDNKGIQMKAELTRILNKENATKEMREIWGLKKPSILAALKKSRLDEVHKILSKLEDIETVHEKEMEDRCIMAALPYILGEKTTHKQMPGELFWQAVHDDSEGVTDIATIVKECKSPKLLSTGSLEEMHSLSLIAEGMVIIKFKCMNIVNAVFCLLSSFYAFDAVYPKGVTGHSKNVFLFLEHLLIRKHEKTLPMGVENFLSHL